MKRTTTIMLHLHSFTLLISALHLAAGFVLFHNAVVSSRPPHQHNSEILMSPLPQNVEDWDTQHVRTWLFKQGFGQYISGFESDYGGLGVDGDRLVYLGTPDQLDHIEWQMELLGVNDEGDQALLSEAIELLVSEGVDASLEVAKGRKTLFNSSYGEDHATQERSRNIGVAEDSQDFQI